MKEFSLIEFIAHIGKMTVEVELEKRHALERAALIVEKEAKALIGHDENPAADPFMAWPALAERTQEDKERLGYVGTVSAFDSELRTGEMRDSIGHRVGEDIALVGSDSDVLVDQELGNPAHNLPPRSILGGAAVRTREEVAETIGYGSIVALVGKDVFNGRIPIPRS